MVKLLLDKFKMSLLLSMVLAIVLIAIRVEKNPVYIVAIVVICLAGTFLLDLDYFIYAYFLEPTDDFSLHLKGFLQHKDYGGAVSYIVHHREQVKERTLNSALFQAILAGSLVFVFASSASLPVKVLLMAAFVNSLYRFSEYYFEGRAGEWFWVLKATPSKQGMLLYATGLLAVLVYSLTIF